MNRIMEFAATGSLLKVHVKQLTFQSVVSICFFNLFFHFVAFFIPMYPTTLVRLSQNSKISFELKDERVVHGTLLKCDQAMNLSLGSVTVINPSGHSSYFPLCYFRGQSIRMLQIDHKLLRKQYLFNRAKPAPSL